MSDLWKKYKKYMAAVGISIIVLLALTAFNYLWLALLAITHLAPISVLILYLTLPIITKSLKKYATLQDKQTTFPLVLKSMSMMLVFYPILYFLGSFL